MVVGSGPPALSGGRTIVLLPPNHDYHTFAIADLISSVTDTCDTALGLHDAVITQISSDEAANAPGGSLIGARLEKFLVGIVADRVRHPMGGVGEHAVGRNDDIALDAAHRGAGTRRPSGISAATRRR